MDNRTERSGRRARVDLIDGFLGAGKTTFIRRYIEFLEQKGISYAVLENEFGAAGVDARLLGGNVRELSGGCICCGQKVNFHNLLIELCEEAERVIVEPSGIFNADDFFDIMDSAEVQRVAECGMMACLVDPFSLDGMTEEDRAVLFDELICAGACLLSRTDRADGETIREAEAVLSALTGGQIPVLDARQADFESLQQMTPARRKHVRRQADHSTLFQSATVYPDGEYSREALLGMAGRLLSGEAGGVLRVKGAVQAAEGGFLSVNAAGSDIEILPGCGPAVLNIIGRSVSRKKIRELLRASEK